MYHLWDCWNPFVFQNMGVELKPMDSLVQMGLTRIWVGKPVFEIDVNGLKPFSGNSVQISKKWGGLHV